ncbi:MAG: chemotaxis protein CheA [Bacteroidales bacterium]|nr:chemotaxis protein CheA [Bacteroidales bacterium]
MLEQFKQKYLDEVNDLLNDLEGAMLELEKNPSSQEVVNEVFRVMHTIKGTSGMYDFKTVEKITHDVESIYGKIRDNHLSVSKEVSALTLECIDLLRKLLNQPDDNDDEQVNDFLAQLALLGGQEPAQSAGNGEEDGGGFLADEADKPGLKEATYYVLFAPEADITGRGVNIKGILADIKNIGTGITMTRSWPEQQADNGKFYMYWEAIFSTSKAKAELDEIFIFVPDEVEITKLSDSNLFMNEDFVAQVTMYQSIEEQIDVNELKALAMMVAPQAETAAPAPASETKEPGPDTAAKGTDAPQQHQAEPHKTDDKISGEEKIIAKNIEASDTKASSIKVDSDKLDELMNLVSELVTTKAELLLMAEKYDIPELSTICEKVDKLSNKFKDNALSIRLVPIESMMLRFQRLVRDLSKELGKKIEFVTDGTDTELDKTIIDNLAVPLMHIIRNSIDHGIEPVERRRELKKPDHGTIKFTAFYSGSNVFIQVQDDGAGMRPDYLRRKAIEKGFIKPGDNPTDRQLYDLVFLPGFSTAQKITGISGRGVGMDVVKQNIIKLRGEIEMDSEIDLGTITTIKLPLTLSIVDALLVSVGNTLLLIPVAIIDSCTQITRNILKDSKGRFIYENEPTPIIDLRKELEISGEIPEEENVVLVKYKDGRVGLIVDRIVGEHQAVLKSLGKYFANQEYISGGSILGDGSIALVLDTNKLIKQLEK